MPSSSVVFLQVSHWDDEATYINFPCRQTGKAFQNNANPKATEKKANYVKFQEEASTTVVHWLMQHKANLIISNLVQHCHLHRAGERSNPLKK